MTKDKPLYHYIALKLNAMRNCWRMEAEARASREKLQDAGSPLYRDILKREEHYEQMYYEHLSAIEQACKRYMPSGSGFDNGTTFDFDKSNDEKLVFNTKFHHMNGNGFYCGWSDHTVIVTPCFGGIDIKVSGKNYRSIKPYISETLYTCLTDVVDEKGDKIIS